MDFTFCVDGVERQVSLHKDGEDYTVTVGDNSYEINHVSVDHGVMYFLVGNRPCRVFLSTGPRGMYLHYAGRSFSLETSEEEGVHAGHHHGGDGNIEAPMPGGIVAVKISVGDKVEVGAPLVVIESMKMQNEITAPLTGEVEAVHCRAGDQVGFGDILVEIKPA